MWTYFTVANLLQALPWATIVTALSIPRLSEASFDLAFFIPATFVILIPVAGAGTAWGRSAGMAGMYSTTRRTIIGLLIAIALLAAIVPVQVLFTDPVLRTAIESTGRKQFFVIAYPPTHAACLASLLWAGSFEPLFWHGFTQSLAARVSNNLWIAIAVVICLRLMVIGMRAIQLHMTGYADVFLVSAAIQTFITGIFYARAGMPATMAISAGLNIHLFYWVNT